MDKEVALVLSSGGPRGFAYIGAIEELEERGYRITSVCGASIGSLVGGVWAAGALKEFKQWLFSLDNFKVMSLLDISLGKSYVVKGRRVISAIKEVVPDVEISSLPVSYTAVASDLYTGEQVIFREGPLMDAIRASISIPSLFKPVKFGHRTLVDGGIVNTFPLSEVVRSGHDILVGFDVNDIDRKSIGEFMERADALRKRRSRLGGKVMDHIDTIASAKGIPMIDKVRMIGDEGGYFLKEKFFGEKESALNHSGGKCGIPVGADDSYYSILDRSFSIMNHSLSEAAIRAYRPDVLARLSLDSYNSISDYAKGMEISEKGRELMRAALDRYEEENS